MDKITEINRLDGLRLQFVTIWCTIHNRFDRMSEAAAL